MARSQPPQRAWAAVAAVTILNLPLGSIYAFSVFLEPIERDLGIARSALSLVFGLASIGFTVGMNLAPLAFGRLPVWSLLTVSTIGAGMGIGLAASSSGLFGLLIGYSALFGIGGGIAYVVLQQAANLLVQRHKGLLNGYIVGLYPAGAMIATPLFGWANSAFGFRVTMAGLAAVLVLSGLAASMLTSYAGARFARPAASDDASDSTRNTAVLVRLSLVFFLAAASGLTVLSQAAGIITAYGGVTGTALAATTAITGAIACARLTGGWLVDRFPIPLVSAFAHGLAAAGAGLLTIWPTPMVSAMALVMIGVGYGFISGCTAGAIAHYWPPASYGRIASRIYVAWCAAAVTLPILAGHLFDLTGGYHAAIAVAGCGNLLGLAVALGLPREGGRHVLSPAAPAAIERTP